MQYCSLINRITITTLALFFAISSNVLAQPTGSIKGKVTDTDNNPIESINISLQGTRYGTATDENGTYHLENITSGQYTLVATSVGYENARKEVTVKDGGTIIADFTLGVATEEMDELTITGDSENDYDTSQISPSLKLATPILKIPQNIQVVTDDLLADQQIFNMIEGVSRNVSGVHRTEHWDNMYARIYMRGSNIPAFRNGMNVTMPWGPLAEDMSMVQRIEFVKGPAGFMMANGEPGGFYNVVTKKPTGQSRASAALTAGSFNTLRATADFDGKISKNNKLLYRLNVMGQQKGSHRQFGFTNRYAIAPVLKYNFDEQTSLTAEYTYQFSQFQQPGGYVASPDGYGTLPRNFTASDPKIGPTEINDHSLFLTLNHRLNKQWKITAKMAYFDYRVFGQYVYPGPIDEEGNMSRDISVWDAKSQNKLGQLFINGEIETGSVQHNILAGLDLTDKSYLATFPAIGQNTIPDLNIYNPEYGIPTDSIPEYHPEKSLKKRADYRDNISQTAIYIQDELHFWDDKIRLTLAGRFTNSDNSGVKEQVITPRVGLSVSIGANSSIYSLYDQAYNPQAGRNFAGERFDPVRGHNIEAGFKRQWLDGLWSSTVSVYRITKENVLTTDPDNPEFSVQLGETQTQGIEIDLKGQLARGLDLVLNYAFTDSKVTEDSDESREGNATPGAIRHLNNAWLSYRQQDGPLEGVGLSLGYQWKIDRTAWFSEDASLPDYFRLDGGVSWSGDRLSIGLNVGNILDEYLYSGFTSGENYVWITEPPRNFRLKVAYNF